MRHFSVYLRIIANLQIKPMHSAELSTRLEIKQRTLRPYLETLQRIGLIHRIEVGLHRWGPTWAYNPEGWNNLR
jgi:DNA-binding HxlR family transcriptional regulator